MFDPVDDHQMDDLFARIDQVRADLGDLNRRTESSVSLLLELRDERDALERQLEELLAQVGAATYDSQHLNHEERTARNTPLPNESPEGVDDARTDASESSPGDDEGIHTPSGPDKEVTVQVNPTSGSSDESLEPIEPSVVDSQPRQSSHDVYIKTANLLPTIKSELGSPPPKIDTFADVKSEMGMLCRAVQPEQLEQWAQLPDEIQRTLASYVAARLRHLQSELESGLTALVADDDRVFEIFSRMKNHMETYWPGYAHGLARDHAPENDSWAEDAAEYKETLDGYAKKYYGEGLQEESELNPEIALNEIEDFIQQEPSDEDLRKFVKKRIDAGLRADDPRLVKLLEPYQSTFEGSDFRKLRAGFAEDDDSEQEEDGAQLIPSDWAWRQKLRRSRVVMIGGDSRPDAKARLEEAFEPAEFHWPSIEENKNMRVVQSWADRIKRGTVDIVILLTKFVSHKVSDLVLDAIKDAAGVELVYINRGYGVSQIRRGIENFVIREESVEYRD